MSVTSRSAVAAILAAHIESRRLFAETERALSESEEHARRLKALTEMGVGIDTEMLTVVQQIQLPAYAHGISIDFDGNVWGVGFNSANAYRVDPVTGNFDTVSGLVSAYTYSDMTGFALSTAGVPSG